MFTEISKFFKTEYPLNEHGLNELFSLFKKENYKKGSIVLKANTKEKKLRFLNKGLIREYYSNQDKEININFYVKPQFISDLLTFSQNSITRKNQECLTDIEVLSIERDSFFNLLEKYDCGKSFVDSSFKKLLKQKEMLEFNRVTKTPDELYKELFIYKPEWLQQIPQYHIASYLNITPETLSRIRKRTS
ncbi:cAMP-binding domain of CRP or a regulatory subunit of cAMP-dependent protein kinases [Flavobacterium sp. 9AF]|uniref:Crp/Fnr family transcriptional regulator n=1 Tax=Flavobacterium sp. 9AF TaxID=2653142 RepID=UPI0012F24AC3|nr:Crp/Fnr family transcriptional regulator [Flavobacterium sp. 9AF]VXC07468.1 cAMP-binding domain of CRP or a regulatory subunit of cAMP-dependent protein kinases [Flavobacterium sp. 9AF]